MTRRMTMRWPEPVFAEIQATAERTGQSFTQAVLAQFAKRNIADEIRNQAESVDRLSRKIDGLAAAFSAQPKGQNFSTPNISSSSREAVLIVTQLILEATHLAEKQRVKVLADRVRSDPENRIALADLLAEIKPLVVDDHQGNLWQNSFARSLAKLRSGG